MLYFLSSVFTVQPTVPAFVYPGAVGTETGVDTANKENQGQKDNLQNVKKQSLHRTGGWDILQYLF